MPLLLPDNVNAATRLISISMRSASDSTDSTISAAIPAIAGGTAAGVVLAVVAVMGWKWWAFIIRRTNKPQCSSSRVRFHVFLLKCPYYLLLSPAECLEEAEPSYPDQIKRGSSLHDEY